MLSHRAMENKFSGLMIEVHPDPDNAWSDAKQQITPDVFSALMDELFGQRSDATSLDLLEELRSEIDTMDEMLVWALSMRMELAQKIAEVKKDSGLKTLQAGRWQQVLDRVKEMAVQSNMDPDFMEGLYNSIHHQSLNLQNGVMKKTNGSEIKKEPNFAF